MKYIQVDIKTTGQGLEPVLTALMEIGITDTVVEDPADIDDLLNKENDYDWDYIDTEVLKLKDKEPQVTVYLEDDDEGKGKKRTEDIKAAISGLAGLAATGVFGESADLGSLAVEITTDDDSRWKDKWKEYFKPAKISRSIVVKPTWENYEAKDGEHVLEIDPGMAFGTGTHETTSLCVKMMEDYMKHGDKVLDVGCGSGILSIAAALLGAEEVLGVEIDPVAVEIARENIELNKVENIASAQYGDLAKGIDFKGDIVVANLMADLVVMLSKDVASHMLPGAKYISSGILVEKAPMVVEELRALGFTIHEVREDGMWCAICASM